MAEINKEIGLDTVLASIGMGGKFSDGSDRLKGRDNGKAEEIELVR